MRKIVLLGIALLLGATASRAQTLPFLLIPSDARPAALGNASVALPGNTFAPDNSMAAAALDNRTAAFGAGYNLWAPQTAKMGVAHLGGWYRTGRLAIGLGGRYCIEQPYDIVSGGGKTVGSYTPKEFSASLGLAYRIAGPFSLGVTARLVSSDLAEKASGTAFGADISAMYAASGFSAAIGVSNLGTPIRYGSTSYAQPMLARAGGAYSAGGFTASLEADYLFAGALMAGLGLEYCIADIVSLRGGFHYGDAAKALPTYASLGLGLQYAGIRLDVTFLTASKTLGNSLMVSLGYAF